MKKKWYLWAAAGLALGAAVWAVCLTRFAGKGAERVYQEEGYRIVGQAVKETELTIPKSLLTEEAYRIGQDYENGEAAAFQTDTTKVFLKRVQPANEGEEFLYFIFDCSYDVKKGNSIISPWKIADGSYGTAFSLADGALRDGRGKQEEAVQVRGQGPGEEFMVYVRTEAVRKASGEMKISARLNEIFYEKESVGLRG